MSHAVRAVGFTTALMLSLWALLVCCGCGTTESARFAALPPVGTPGATPIPTLGDWTAVTHSLPAMSFTRWAAALPGVLGCGAWVRSAITPIPVEGEIVVVLGGTPAGVDCALTVLGATP